ncbi:MAG: TonB-dependent receptor plug domain-containing protein [Planctomycetes bacterium]|nr:TonB-dependent receptor plug domain-containing protein [Planctomycetota bacterium]
MTSAWLMLPELRCQAATQQPDAADQQETADDLLMFEELPIVVTAARNARPINYAPVPVSVLTAEDIHYSGLTTIPELLQFLPGIDMLRADRNRYSVGIRGLHDVTSDRTIALVDGRNASSPMFGGPEFLRLPLLVEDIERIEVVRGPGGAAWGANAFNGVINIITKKPEDTSGVLLRSTINTFGDSETQLRWGGTDGATSWRVSAGYVDYASSSDALDSSSFSSKDFARGAVIDTSVAHRISETARLSAGVGYSNREEGDFALFGLPTLADGSRETLRAFVRIDETLSDSTRGYLQLFNNYQDTTRRSISVFDANETDLEGQLDFTLTSNHELSVGGNLRWQHLDTDAYLPNQVTFASGPRDEYWAGLFAVDRFAFSDAVTLETQLRGDYYSETQFDWSGRSSLLYSFDDSHRHVSRLSVARAFRAPLSGLGQVSAVFSDPIGTPIFLFASNADLENERLTSYEAGHTLRYSRSLSFRLDGFYHDYDNLIGYVSLPGFPVPVQSQNLAGANGAGGEFEGTWSSDDLKMSMWYGYEDFRMDQVGQSIRAAEPARHKAGANARTTVAEDWTLNLNYKYTGETYVNNFPTPKTYGDIHRLDLTVTRSFDHGDVSLGVSDILDQSGPVISTHETPGTTFFIAGTLHF